ncbi:hypothetical protein DmGdi_16770 [Gluconobacter sp. Gdi]|nr:hypothetical protein DmGdi_16770 [Gluconobacter sp. Gdi]
MYPSFFSYLRSQGKKSLGIAGTVHLVLMPMIHLPSSLLIALSILLALSLCKFITTLKNGEKAMMRDLMNPSKTSGALTIGILASIPGMVPPL